MIKNPTTICTHLHDTVTGLDIPIIIELNSRGLQIEPARDEDQYVTYNHIFPRDIWLEYYDGELVLRAWDGTSEDPVVNHTIIPRKTEGE